MAGICGSGRGGAFGRRGVAGDSTNGWGFATAPESGSGKRKRAKMVRVNGKGSLQNPVDSHTYEGNRLADAGSHNKKLKTASVLARDMGWILQTGG